MTQNYKRIAKNTLFLYFRMIIIMAVSFYTVRVVLDILGVTDFGLYNLVASFVMIMAVLNSTLTGGTQRFLTFEIGKDDFVRLKQTFSTALVIHIALAFFILFLGETIGLWLLYEKMNIPVERFDAAFWVYQFAIASTMVTVMQVPYNALIIAHERMHIFAYVSIVEAILKLLVVYLLLVISFDKLIVYGILMFLVSLSIATFYRVYVMRNYEESHFSLSFDKEIVKSMLQFSGWNLFGTLGAMLSNHGISLLLNLYFGPVANAAHAISMQVSGGLNQFVNSFQTAMTPQITKLYAANRIDELNNFLYQNTKYAFLLLWIVVLPIILKLDYVLSVWLTQIPQNTMIFTKLLMIYGLMYSFIRPMVMAIQATGKVKGIQMSAGILLILVLPISWVLLENNFPIYSPFVVMLCMWIFHILLEIFFLKRLINFSTISFLRISVAPLVIIISISLLLLNYLSHLIDNNIYQMLLFFVVSMFVNFVLIYFIGIDLNTRKKVKQVLVNRYKNLKGNR
ncbi:oligosaccharide flippase family protein [Sulfurovum mangrovi]|uniref:oligosaccharide flippase family protein n=1 Tax=Sulfurovum mangrovi TaxID=2893889 RepID=UPI00384E8F7C